ncbi:MAG TPA: carboxypeptidase regulatory-like domain-containing protein [Candidatus Sulfotelmatobacter sp.]
MKIGKIIVIATVLVSALLSASLCFAQAGTGILKGQVTDPSGAAITKADVALTPASGSPLSTQTDTQGMYAFKGLAPGEYTLDVVAQGFTLYENTKVEIAAQPVRLNVTLQIEVQTQKVQVSDTAPTVDVNPANNAGAITISSKELEALPDDPDELLTDLQALAGPSAGPNGGQMYIDGFTAGQLPPKSSIREIRINSNPFSSEYDKLGYGRIEIFTKPGTDKLHGQFLVNGNDSAFNSHDPFAGPEPPYDSVQYNGNIGGALNKNGSFFVNVERRNINDLSAIDAQTLDQNLNPIQTFDSVPFPHQRTNIGPRLDYALSKNNTLTTRYQYWRDTETNDGIGQNALSSQAYDEKTIEHTLQVGDTQVYGAKVVNETRFQYLRDETSMKSLDLAPQVSVLGAFTGGGNGTISSDHEDHYELQNYTSVIRGNHTVKFGVRLRTVREANTSTNGFNGTFTFSSLDEFQAAECALQASPPPACKNAQPAVPRQLSITTGSPYADLTTYDAGLYVQDDWRVRPNITLSIGLRFETQNDIHDHADLAPRLGFAWGVHGRSGPPIVVIRGGAGIFYDRFQAAQILQAERLNGVTEQQFVIENPTCFPGLDEPLNTAIANCGPARTSAIYQISPSLMAPYTLQSAISVERQLTKSATLVFTYLNSRGFDQLGTINADAPPPGTPCFPNCPPPTGELYQFESEGVFRQHQFIVNSNIRVGSKLQLFTYYVLNHANSDTGGVNSFASNSYNISQDYGRASFDTRQRLFLGGSIAMKYGLRFSPFMVASSGSPFNISTFNDLNGDSFFNDRPGLVSSATCPSVVLPGAGSTVWCTPLGTFDAVPTPSEKIVPVNYATGPSHFSLNFRLAKTFGFGPEVKGNQGAGRSDGGHSHRGGPLYGGGGPMGLGSASDRRYQFTLSGSVRNVFNKVNFANPGGVLGSPFFDRYNDLQGGPFNSGVANRRIDVQASFSF